MHQVRRALIMAAGMGKRMLPITLKTPKPLVRVHGVRMIDTAIKALYSNGITEIHIVAGYLQEQFRMLAREYGEIHIIENPFYDTCNNISSLYAARDYLEDAIILDGDQLIMNEAVLEPFFEKSGYNAVWTDSRTEEWLMEVQSGRVVSCSRSGGEAGWQLFSISRWTAEDGKRLRRHLEEEFVQKQNRHIYWDDVVMFSHFKEYDLGIRPMNKGDVIEVDSLEELADLDKDYEGYLREFAHR